MPSSKPLCISELNHNIAPKLLLGVRRKSYFVWPRRRKPPQIREERRDLERHLLVRRKKSNGLGLHHFYPVAPRVQLDPAAQRESRDLIGTLHFELRSGVEQSRHPNGFSVSCTVSVVGSYQVADFRRARLQSLEIGRASCRERG